MSEQALKDALRARLGVRHDMDHHPRDHGWETCSWSPCPAERETFAKACGDSRDSTT